MTNEIEQLEALAVSVYGYGWQTKLAKDLCLARATTHRWANDKCPIPKWVWVFLALKRDLKERGAA